MMKGLGLKLEECGDYTEENNIMKEAFYSVGNPASHRRRFLGLSRAPWLSTLKMLYCLPVRVPANEISSTQFLQVKGRRRKEKQKGQQKDSCKASK